ncbi:MAG TPA: hypothetical protein VKW76_07010 [Candidatus Binatia bacterium]|nr:hypothetical protein [Candidatus Binatia bacterium]
MFGRIVGMLSVMALVGAVGGVTTVRAGGAVAGALPQVQAAAPHDDEPAPPDDPGTDGEDDSGDDYAR